MVIGEKVTGIMSKSQKSLLSRATRSKTRFSKIVDDLVIND